MALGMVFSFWGLATMWLITAVGALLIILALTGWLKTWHEASNDNETKPQ
jgi:hypothetical protein